MIFPSETLIRRRKLLRNIQKVGEGGRDDAYYACQTTRYLGTYVDVPGYCFFPQVYLYQVGPIHRSNICV